MKFIKLLFLSLMIVSCNDSTDECKEKSYGEEFELSINGEICFEDGRLLAIDEITLEVCPINANCPYYRRFSVLLSLTESNGESETFVMKASYGGTVDLANNYNLAISSFSYDGIEENLEFEKFEDNLVELNFVTSPN